MDIQNIKRSIVYSILLTVYTTTTYAEWKAIVIAGSKAQPVFDNARMTISGMLDEKGIDNRTLTSDEIFTTIDPSVDTATPMNIVKATNSMRRKINDKCFIYITSHGSKDAGIAMMEKLATPAILDTYINNACRGAPAVIVISACYSGQFIDRGGFARSDRIILTASHKDRTSFGCSNDRVYTFYDACFIENFDELGSWENLHNRVSKCVTKKENEINAYLKSKGKKLLLPSEPQFFKGSLIN